MAKKDKLIWRETKEIPDPEMNVNGIVESRWRELEVKAAAVGRGQGWDDKSQVLVFSPK